MLLWNRVRSTGYANNAQRVKKRAGRIVDWGRCPSAVSLAAAQLRQLTAAAPRPDVARPPIEEAFTSSSRPDPRLSFMKIHLSLPLRMYGERTCKAYHSSASASFRCPLVMSSIARSVNDFLAMAIRSRTPD